MKSMTDYTNLLVSVFAKLGTIAPVETSPSTHAYAVGFQLMYEGVLYTVTTAISIGDNLVTGSGSGANLTASADLVAQIAALKLTAGTNIQINNGVISATDTTYENKAAASGGTDVSLVTTGDKYNWNGAVTAVGDAYQTGDTAETAIDDADYVPFYDSSATGKRKSLWSNIKAVLKTYFDTLYSTVRSSSSAAEGGTDLSLVTTGEKYTWGAKQNALTFDSTPTQNSLNPVTSGGLYTALGNKANAPTIMSTTITAGNTDATFTNIPTTGNWLVSVHTSDPEQDYESIDASTAGTLVYTFAEQESTLTVYLRLEEVV